MDLERPRCAPGLRFYQWLMEQGRTARPGNQQRLREIKRQHAGTIQIMSSHDVREFERAAGHSLDVPVLEARGYGS